MVVRARRVVDSTQDDATGATPPGSPHVGCDLDRPDHPPQQSSVTNHPCGDTHATASRFIVILVALLLALLPIGAAGAQPLDLHDLGAPSFTSFSTHDGLPNTVIQAVQTDREGFVWAATPVGVYRYDGQRWTASPDPAMAHPVDALYVDHEGTLWAAMTSNGLARYDGHRWHVENRASGLPTQDIRRFAETTDVQGHVTLWALTWDRGLMLRRDGRWQLDPDNASLPPKVILSMAQTIVLDGHRRQWVGSNTSGLWYRDEGIPGWKPWDGKELRSVQIEYLRTTIRDGHEVLWISAMGLGLWRLDEHGLRRWSVADGGLPSNQIYDFTSTKSLDGSPVLWVSTRGGLVRLHDDHIQVFNRSHGLPSDVIRGLYAWRSPGGNEVLWLATEGGVARSVLDANAWTTASLAGAHSTGVYSVRVDTDAAGRERLWVGANDGGLSLYDDGRWRTFTQADGSLAGPGVRVIQPIQFDGAGLWIGQVGGALSRERDGPDDPIFERAPTPWPVSNGDAVLSVFERRLDGHNELWVGTRTGLYLRRDGAWSATRLPGVNVPWRCMSLVETIDSASHHWLWASTDHGLAHFDGTHWELFGRKAGLPDDDLMAIRTIDDAHGRPVLWIGTWFDGIARVDIGDPAHPKVLPNDLPKPPNPSTYGALADSKGRVYICTNNGVQQLTPAGGGYRSRVFTRADGMVHDECNVNAQFIDSHDRYWAGTLGGLTVYDPNAELHDDHAKPLRLLDVRIDGRAVDADPVHVPAGARDIAIHYGLLSWNREEDSRYRTQLIGYEDAPEEWTAESTRNFSSLPPGDYTLRVEARDYAGNLAKPFDLAIEVDAHWWQQRWAELAGVLLLVLAGYGIAHLRTRRLRAQRRALEQRVIERTAELDTANTRLLELSYTDALTGLANRRRLLERIDKLPTDVATGTPTALVFIDVDHFKNFNDTWGHPAGDEALRVVAQTLRERAPECALVARYGGEEFACLLPGEGVETATQVAETFRQAVAERDIVLPGTTQTRRVTISAGVASATIHALQQTHPLLREADMALYQAKREGRNRVCVLEQPPGAASASAS
ncbi:MAG: diguanylate cyclase [Proteobacteria bacterium]|nr:diguanylate cyclase [Pseudomonadota bacterium]